jgi:hypothetical protein
MVVNISKRVETTVSVLLQVLYFLHHGHVQYLLGEYRATVTDLHGPDAFIHDKTPRLVRKDKVSTGPPRTTHALGLDNSKVEDDVDMNDDASGLEITYTCDDEDDEAYTSISSTTQREARLLQEGTHQRLLTIPKRLASALTPRHAQSRATTKSWVKPKPIRSTSFRERVGPSEPPGQRGWDIFLGHPYTYVSVTIFSVFSSLC